MSNLPQVHVNNRKQLIKHEKNQRLSVSPNIAKRETYDLKPSLSKGQSESSNSRKDAK